MSLHRFTIPNIKCSNLEDLSIPKNSDKCVNLTLNQKQSSVKCLDGTPVPRKKPAFYLGTLITDTVDNHREITNRIAECTCTCNQLKLFWNKAKTSIKWKVQVFHSILRSELLCGLETIQLNLTDQKRIDSFQLKRYWRILHLHLPPTYIDRTITNDFVKSQIRIRMNTELKMFSLFGKNVSFPFLVILSDLRLVTLWDKFCLKKEL